MTNIFFITLLFMISTPSFADNDKNVPVHSPAKGQLSAKDKSAAKQKELLTLIQKVNLRIRMMDGLMFLGGLLTIYMASSLFLLLLLNLP